MSACRIGSTIARLGRTSQLGGIGLTSPTVRSRRRRERNVPIRRPFSTSSMAATSASTSASASSFSTSTSSAGAIESTASPTTDATDATDAIAADAVGLISTLSDHLLHSPLSAGTTIILLTLLVRSGVTLPATIWQRRRARRTREIVVPEMRRVNEELALVLAGEYRREGRGYEEYKAALKEKLAAHQILLHKKHSTHPLITLLTPLVIHVPILITLSLSIRGAIDAPASDWAEQAFAWVPRLGDPDGSVILPLIGGMTAMVNAEMAGRKGKGSTQGTGAETGGSAATALSTGTTGTTMTGVKSTSTLSSSSTSSTSSPASTSSSSSTSLPSQYTSPRASRRFSTSPPTSKSKPTKTKSKYISPVLVAARERERGREREQERERAKSVGKLSNMGSEAELEKEKEKADLRQRFMSMVLRGAAVIFVPFAAQVPAALALYWTTSMVYTMGQNAILDHLEGKIASPLARDATAK